MTVHKHSRHLITYFNANKAGVFNPYAIFKGNVLNNDKNLVLNKEKLINSLRNFIMRHFK